MYDVEMEMALQDFHDKAVMKRATQEQCIFLFVEGDCEANAFPELLYGSTDLLATLGVRVANYKGRGNLGAALRLLKSTLSSDRLIILTYDNDPESTKSLNGCRKNDLIDNLVYEFPIPLEPVVTYPSGHRGGSFEESFPPASFIAAAFHESILPFTVRSGCKEFMSSFDPLKPWFTQLKKFCAQKGFYQLSKRKTAIAELLLSEIKELPETYVTLRKLIKDVRASIQSDIPTTSNSRKFEG
jgi:hypothetical protein